MTAGVPNVPYWQAALGRPSEVVAGIDDIGQCIHLLLVTPALSVPLLPLGLDVTSFKDRPMPEAKRKLERDALDVIRQGEPRVTDVRVQALLVSGVEGHVALVITWRPKGGTDAVVQVVGVGRSLVTTRTDSTLQPGAPGGLATLDEAGLLSRAQRPPVVMPDAAVTWEDA